MLKPWRLVDDGTYGLIGHVIESWRRENAKHAGLKETDEANGERYKAWLETYNKVQERAEESESVPCG